jgi:hypothetical protein
MQTTGKIGDLLVITGSGFYEISSVVFGGNASGDFRNPINEVRVAVPEFAAWGTVTITSASRQVTGFSIFPFVPEPKVTGFFPTTGLPGNTITILGRAFSGVTGVTFNNLNATSFTVLSNSGISAVLPTGNTKGYVTVFGQSGLSFHTQVEFIPYAYVTGLSQSTIRTGESLDILGINFIPEIMYQTSSNKYLVTIGSATGEFTRINSGKLQGPVFLDASSGPVFVNRTTTDSYASSASLTIVPYSPIITRVVPESGKANTSCFVEGENFYGVTSLLLSGYGSGFQLTGYSTTIISSLGNAAFFNLPYVANGKYDLILVASGGSVTGSGLVTVLDIPIVSGFYPTAATGGSILRISGHNFYPFSKIYFNSLEAPELEIVSGSGTAYFDVRVPVGNQILNSIIIDNGVFTGVTGNFTLIYAPGISSFSPISGGWGTKVNMSGSGLSFATNLYFDSQDVAFSAIGDTGLQFLVPTGSNDSVISLITSGGSGVSTVFNVILPPPIISGFTPTGVKKNDTLTITGWLSGVTGVKFTGVSGEANAAFTFTPSGAINTTVPILARDGGVSLETESGRVTSSTVYIMLPPQITGFIPASGIYQKTITISGQNFVSGETQFYFLGVTGNLISGINTSILSPILAQTKVPREIVSAIITTSGRNEFSVSPTIFTPLPTINSFTPAATNTALGNSIVINAINAFNVDSGYLFFSGASGLINNIVDSGNLTADFSALRNGSNGFTLITGYINSLQTGTGFLALVNIRDTSPASGFAIDSVYSTAMLTLTGASPTITGIISNLSGNPLPTGGYTIPFKISGINFNSVTGVKLYHILSTTREDTIITGRTPTELTIAFDIFKFDGNSQVVLEHRFGNPVTGTQIFTVTHPPFVSSITPSPVLTGNYIRLEGNSLDYVTGTYLVDGFGNRLPMQVVLFTDVYYSGFIPGEISLSNQDVKVETWNAAGWVSSRVQIVNQRDLDLRSDLEAQSLIFGGQKSDLTTQI